MQRDINRKPLQDIVPLERPFTLYIEPTNHCNLNCQFCPTGLRLPEGGTRGLMPWDLFEKIIADIKHIGSPKTLNWYFFGESTTHRRFAEMVSYARTQGISGQFRLKTNGTTLNSDLIDELVSCGLDMICISIEEVSNEGYLEIAKKRIDYNLLRNNVAELYRKRNNVFLYVKTVDHGQSIELKQKFFSDFEKISSLCKIESLHGLSDPLNSNFTLGTKQEFPATPRICCPIPFYSTVIRWNGKVVNCCVDWSNATEVGDVGIDSLADIWNGERLRKFRLMHLRGKRWMNAACGKCGIINDEPDNIDQYREQIDNKITGENDGSSGESHAACQAAV